ncbi:hypothetical protein JCM19046_4141 [Bacillus sp. JCM 19046]|nr:hypothetical protein JCM19045_3486 [Bacillus sp. JCM 19045]GAF19486.1 hypothetical protein JCM19046_4141 [Bacillus sp. JCM 19046]
MDSKFFNLIEILVFFAVIILFIISLAIENQLLFYLTLGYSIVRSLVFLILQQLKKRNEKQKRPTPR